MTASDGESREARRARACRETRKDTDMLDSGLTDSPHRAVPRLRVRALVQQQLRALRVALLARPVERRAAALRKSRKPGNP